VQYGDFSETDVKQEKLKLKRHWIWLNQNLSVIVTLFDFTVITHSNWTLTHRHAKNSFPHSRITKQF
jgi:hypothetical protein